MVVRLAAKTRRGKNKLHEHGANWEVKEVRPGAGPGALEHLHGDWMLLHSIRDSDERWVLRDGDPHFTVVEEIA